MTVGSFLCLCPPKAVKLCDCNLIRRSHNVEHIRTSLESVDFGGKRKIVICLPGGGVAAEGTGSCPEVAVEGPLIAVLSGTIHNYAYLVRKYFVEEVGLPRNVSLETIRQTTPIRDAAVLCKLYSRIGTSMLTKLRGRFAFCLYDSDTVRVLAARDPTGSVGLVEGQTEEGDLFVASGAVRPEGVKSVAEIQPGKYKYGWRASSRKFASPQDLVDDRAAAATNAAVAALSGLNVKDRKLNPQGVQAFELDHRRQTVLKTAAAAGGIQCTPKFQTKAQVREWSAAVAKQAIQSYEEEVAKGEEAELVGSWFVHEQDNRQKGVHSAPSAPSEIDIDDSIFAESAVTGTNLGKNSDPNSSDESCQTHISSSNGSKSSQSPMQYSIVLCGETFQSSVYDTCPLEGEDSSTMTDVSLTEPAADGASETNSSDSLNVHCPLPETTLLRN